MQDKKESLVLHNPHHSVISFRLDKSVDEHIAKMSRHKQKRLVRCFSHNVALPSRQSVDLVPLTGLTVKEIKDSPEYLQMQKYFQVMYDSSLAVEDVVEPEDTAPEEVDPIDLDDLDGVLTEDKADTLDEVFEEIFEEDYIESEVVIEKPVETPIEEPEPEGFEEPEEEVKPSDEALIAQAEELIAREESVIVENPEPEPEPEKVAPKKRKPAKKAKKSTKKPAKKAKK